MPTRQHLKMKFAIRDDDTCFFTKPEELECAYDFLTDGCVSLSVVPCTVTVHRDDVFPYGTRLNPGYYSLGENKELVGYLKNGHSAGKYDILQHGYSHEYKKINGTWTAEMVWKSETQLTQELADGKKMLEELLGCQITTFVAPNNAIDQKAIAVLENLHMNYSGIIQHRDRQINARYITNYLKRWVVRMTRGIPYPGGA